MGNILDYAGTLLGILEEVSWRKVLREMFIYLEGICSAAG